MEPDLFIVVATYSDRSGIKLGGGFTDCNKADEVAKLINEAGGLMATVVPIRSDQIRLVDVRIG